MSDSIINNMSDFIVKLVQKFLSKDNKSCFISAGFENYAISQGRTLNMVGNNTYGQIGNGTRRNSKVPVPISLPSTIIWVASGQCFTVAITKDGKVYSWGTHVKTICFRPINSSVKEGTGDNLIPILVKKIKSRRAIKVSASTWNYIVLFDDGSVFIKVQKRKEGFMFSLDHKIVDVAINSRAYLITENGSLFEADMGSGILMRKETETLDITTRQIKLPGKEKVVKISTGGQFLTILSDSGKVYTYSVSSVWTTDDGKEHPNANTSECYPGKYGPGGSFLEKRDPPSFEDLGGPISTISSNYDTAMAVSKDGELYIWCPEVVISTAIDIPTGRIIKDIYAGYNFAILLLDNNDVYYWGNERFPKLKF
uniref:Regulator of chromosome condensation protein n=1 Tax=Pithovirus LCPAC201 TaxID=2506591 RepID=A0A481Z8M0_9VIRU|nr:MAG: regulator of chromosome condensation protein [Pithovirus LCPAC201]